MEIFYVLAILTLTCSKLLLAQRTNERKSLIYPTYLDSTQVRLV